ncbi:hypothetical protein M8C21_009187 [Ambrosia artemisiifolia]|uniref:Uncharacterized protein n=1 Tax=Ambrosia artemisiifolia TaxID=4212 RepID=A0AAD5BYC6_AMBAR|nr:hypothetical protein M8C21_009187 [Ambrosia artemisiifolia]
MEGWEVWSTNNEVFDAVFPCLRELNIENCPQLIEVSLKPLLSVEILMLRGMRGWKGWSINMEVSVLPYLRKLHIDNCPELIKFPPETSNNEVFDAVFPCLKELYINRCPQLIEFSPKTTNSEVSVFPSLRELHISFCPKLIEFSPEKLPKLEILRLEDMLGWKIWSTKDAVFPRLRELYINSCPQLVEVSAEALPLLRLLEISFCDHVVLRSLVQAALSITMLGIVYISGLTYEKFCELSHLFPSSLSILKIVNFDKLGSLSMGLQHLTSLQHLTIKRCPKMKHLPKQLLPKLLSLKIKDCPKLTKRSGGRGSHYYPLISHIPNIRDMIKESDLQEMRYKTLCDFELNIVYASLNPKEDDTIQEWRKQGVVKLGFLQIQHLTSIHKNKVWRGVIEHIGAVEEVSIWNCNEIRYLWESEEEASKVLVNIKKLKVMFCSNLVSLGEKEEEDNFGSSLLSSLRLFCVYGCDKMERCCCPNSIESLHIERCSSLTHVSFPTSATGGDGGQKLKSLDIWDCSKLMEKINNSSTGVLERIYISGWTNLKSLMQLGNFIYLTWLHLDNCPSLESFPDIPLPVLTYLRIEKCERMESFSAHQMSNLTSLKELIIINCANIDTSGHGGVWPPNLCSLEIGRLKKPMSEWGPQSFPSSLVHLSLHDEADVKNFRQLSHLLFPSLTKLRIYNFEELESVSMGVQHLTSLQHLIIWGIIVEPPDNVIPPLYVEGIVFWKD